MKMEEKAVVLEVKKLCKFFGGIKAVNNIDIKLYKGEIIAIVGDNGAGKSTLIKTISGIYKKNSGEIYINGDKADINNPNDARRYGIETVYQDGGVVPTFNAYLNLFLGREKIQDNKLGKWLNFVDFKYMKKETQQLLKRVGVDFKNIDSELSNLSGGQRQSVIVGKAVYWGGQIIILDEPTNNLGVKQQKKVIDLIKKIRNEYNISIIIITHNINHVFELVDRIIVLRNGIKVAERIKTETNQTEVVSLITGAVTA
ncbi:MAG: ATP-binding cassette domain-containing protein [Clostridia bacterium]|nr:ATP-binding cassette domain-containing protein [Clostridia bacterium]